MTNEVTYLNQEVAGVTLQIKGHLEHRKFALAPREGQVAVGIPHEVELRQRHSRLEVHARVVLPLVHQLTGRVRVWWVG